MWIKQTTIVSLSNDMAKLAKFEERQPKFGEQSNIVWNNEYNLLVEVP